MRTERMGFLISDEELPAGATKLDQLERFLDGLNERQPDFVDYETTIYLGDDEVVLVKLEWEDPPLRVVHVPEETDLGVHLTPGVSEQSETDFVDITKGFQTGEITNSFNSAIQPVEPEKTKASFVDGGIFSPPEEQLRKIGIDKNG